MKRTILLIILAIAAISLVGCGTATLSTKVEVYNPQGRLTQLEMEHCNAMEPYYPPQKKATLMKYLKKRVEEEKHGAVDLAGWIDQGIAQIRGTENIQNELDAIYDSYINGEEIDQNIKTAFQNKKVKDDPKLKSLRDDSIEKLTDFKTAYAKDGDFDKAYTETKRVIENFAQASADVIDTDFIKLLGGDLDVRNLSTLKAYKLNFKSIPGVMAQNFTGRDGIFRPDTVIETTTDPLISIADLDKGGWTTPITQTFSDAQGKCDFVIIREAPSSFTVHAVYNDPTKLVRSTMRMAESTMNVIAQVASSYVGIPSLSKPKPKPGEAAQDTTGQVDGGGRPLLTSNQMNSYAKVKFDNATSILAEQTPVATSTPDVMDRWVDKVEALLEPIY